MCHSCCRWVCLLGRLLYPRWVRPRRSCVKWVCVCARTWNPAVFVWAEYIQHGIIGVKISIESHRTHWPSVCLRLLMTMTAMNDDSNGPPKVLDNCGPFNIFYLIIAVIALASSELNWTASYLIQCLCPGVFFQLLQRRSQEPIFITIITTTITWPSHPKTPKWANTDK